MGHINQKGWYGQTTTGITAYLGTTCQVIVTGHVPPGYSTPRAVRWMSTPFNNRLLDILSRHSTVIVAMHFGHEHHDNFRLLYNSSGVPVISVFIAPSVTPWRYRIAHDTEPAHNPGVRLVKYDKQTGKQLDIVQYYVDLAGSNAGTTMKWILGYNATQLYGVPDVSAASMHEVAKKLDSFGGHEFGYYQTWYNTNPPGTQALCDRRCHKVVMCGIRNMDDDGFQKCLKAQTSCSTNINACPIVG